MRMAKQFLAPLSKRVRATSPSQNTSKDGYDAIQLGFDEKKDRLVNKPLKGILQKQRQGPALDA